MTAADDSRSPTTAAAGEASFEPPWPGSHQMPRWGTGPLIEPPKVSWKNWIGFIGPGLVMGASAIGGGEWLLGPLVTAKYGGAVMWLATLSILGQALYNTEISRYTLYCGEPIFSGKFRTLPGPQFWILVYLLLDFGSIFPYLAANAATPVEVVLLGGKMPDPTHVAAHWWLRKILSTAIFLLAIVPLFVGGKVYNSLKIVMSFKLVVVLGFLVVLGVFYTQLGTWKEILTGFVRFGSVPVVRTVEDEHGNLVRRPAQSNEDVENVFVVLFTEGRLPEVDFSLIAFIAAMAAIAGNGGLSNAPLSNYTRDQGWGMGYHVGAIPSIVGGHGIKLSHVGSVFHPTPQTLPRWKGWYRHVARDQILIWAPACFVGLALPSMLSIQFLPRGTDADRWNAAVMTAEGVATQVADPPPGVLASTLGLDFMSGEGIGRVFWALTLFCGFLVLGTSLVATIDGVIRRWVDAFWTASRRMRGMSPGDIKYVYFAVLLAYTAFGVLMLWINPPDNLIKYSTIIYNFALGFSCWHTLVINCVLLPRPLRPNWLVRGCMMLAGVFFTALGTVSTAEQLGWL